VLKKLLFPALILVILVIILAAHIAINKTRGKAPLAAPRGDNGSIAGLSSRAKELEGKGDFSEARVMYQKLINEFPSANSNDIMTWQKKTEEMNIKLLFSPILTPNSMLYEIKPGDTLTKISREFKTTPELIMKSNILSGDKILPGRKIKIWTAPFSILVDKSQNTLILKANEEIIRTYIVSTGKNNSTPVGVFKIVNKLPNPTWFKAGAVVPPDSPKNILGSRWLGFDLPGYGIHGTTEPKSLGTQATQGCVRMLNSEVEELYTIVPTGTEVTIVD
jgi:lipoprotein-anchoring transpeptidase ErfK/SrfK